MAKTTDELVCIKTDELQTHSRKIERLEAQAQYREQRMDELNEKISAMDKKIDKVLDGFNELKIKSHNDDKELELRLTTIETKLTTQDRIIEENRKTNQQLIENNRAKTNQLIAVISLVLGVLTLYFHYIG